MTNCVCCGRKIWGKAKLWKSNVYHTEWNNQPLCKQCASKLSSERLKEAMKDVPEDPSENSPKTCFNCGFSKQSKLLTRSLENMESSTVEHRYKDNWACSKFGFDITHNYDIASSCSSYLSIEEYEKKCLSGEIGNGNATVQVFHDFSSLKEVLSHGGLIMTAVKCPICNAVVNLPEKGKTVKCSYCGTPIKPSDIFEKIKALTS
jgi:hypothetical protein